MPSLLLNKITKVLSGYSEFSIYKAKILIF